MVKLASTILAFPEQTLSYDLMTRLSSIEWTAQKLKEKKASFTKVDTMLSIIDMRNKKGTLCDDNILEEIALNIMEGAKQGIYQYVYGSPVTRDFSQTPNKEETINIFLNLANKINQSVKNITNKVIKFYIEPLPHKDNWLSQIYQIIDITNSLNHRLNENPLDIGLQFMPLIDIGSMLKQNLPLIASESIANCTDRVHLSQIDNTQGFDKIPAKALKFVEELCSRNENLTISYEYINKTNDNSLQKFIDYFSRILLQKTLHYDVAIIGTGIYGRYIAENLSKKGLNVALVGQEKYISDNKNQTASYVNQARVHNGYHYPRSFSTAIDSVRHYHQFINDFKPAIIDNFQQIYAIPKYGSVTSAKQFVEFCNKLNVKCNKYITDDLKIDSIQGSFLTDEKAIDTSLMMDIMKDRTQNVKIYDLEINTIDEENDTWYISDYAMPHLRISANYLINASYSGINVIEKLANRPITPVKLEVCEIALFSSKSKLINAYTFMDGPFISIMPFSQDGLISMTSVTYTPNDSTRYNLKNIKSKKDIMLQEAKRFLSDDYLNNLEYKESRFVIKTVPLHAENDDNRLVQINKSKNFASVLSGKLNAIYETDVLCNDISKLLHSRKTEEMNF